MIYEKISDEAIAKIELASISRFLARRGYTREEIGPANTDIFSAADGTMVLVPRNSNARDYARRLRDALEVFTNDDTPIDDVIAQIVLPQSDVMRYRIATPESTWGHLRLQYTQEAMGALYNTLLYTAAGVSSQRTDYRRVSETAKSFAEQCRFGQTEHGSFVLKVFCPVKPVVAEDDAGEPFGRQTTRALVENLDFLASGRSEDPEEPLPPTLNQQVATSVTRLKPRDEFGATADVQMRYLSLDPGQLLPADNDVPLQDEVAKLELGPFIYSRAQQVSERLRQADEFSAEVLRGHVETLHKDRPVRDTEQSHEVTLDVKYGTSRRKLRVRLLPPEYRNAMRWHDSNTEVQVDAVVDKRGKVWSVNQLNSFDAVQAPGEQVLPFPPRPDGDDQQ